MRVAVTSGDPARPIALAQAERPVPLSNEAVVRVAAISLNSGEVRRAAASAAGKRVGWDIAGTVEQPAADGSGPPRRSRVVTFVEGTGWAEYVAAPAGQLGLIPDGVTFADASTLPIAGLTALRALRRGGDLLGKRVLIVPGTGGVGLFATQLAAMRGAHVTAVVRNPSHVGLLENCGAENVIVGATREARDDGPYDVILDSLGGESLGDALAAVAPEGVVVSFGNTIATEVTFDSRAFYLTGGASLYGFIIFHEARRDPIARDLERLAELVREQQLVTRVDATFPFERIDDAVEVLRERRITGKVVVTLIGASTTSAS